MVLFVALLEREGQGSRARIMEALRRNPGMNQSQLCKVVNLSWATTKYHLKRLEAQGAIELQRLGRRDVQCFPVSIPAKYRPWLAALLDDDALAVLRALGPSGRAGVRELSLRVGLSESAMRRCLERMEEAGIISKKGLLRPVFMRSEALSPELEVDKKPPFPPTL